jgi:hypothetical protein
MRLLLMMLVGVLLFMSGCAAMEQQSRDEPQRPCQRLRERLQPEPLVWGGLHPGPQPANEPWLSAKSQTPLGSFIGAVLPGLGQALSGAVK